MHPPHGFVVLTHAHPGQLRRLLGRLDATFGGPPVVVHHDFGQAPFSATGFPPEVEFVRDWVPTAWASYSLVEATLRALRLMAARRDCPEWVTILSGADYPLRSAAAVLADLEGGGADAYVQHVLVEPGRLPPTERAALWGCDVGESARSYRECLRRHFRLVLRVPLPGVGTVRVASTSNPRLTRWLAPYGAGRRCFAGSQWLTLRRPALRYLLDWHDANPWLADYLRPRFAPDESYAHTVLCNAPGLRVANRNFRYLDWSGGGQHPRLLDAADLPAMLASGAHFARKFAPDAPVLDALDGVLDGISVRAAS